MQYPQRVLWRLVNDTERKEGPDIPTLMPLIDTLFPGVDYYSITGAGDLCERCLMPAARTLWSELATVPLESIAPDAMVEVPELLRCEGYQWQDDPEWMTRFQEALERKAA